MSDSKRIKLNDEGRQVCNIKKFFIDEKYSGFEKLLKVFNDGELSELQLGELLEHYLLLFPNFFQFLDQSIDGYEGKFRNEVIALFESKCVPFFDLISKITIYSSISTIRSVSAVLLRDYIHSFSVRPASVVLFVTNAVGANKTQCRFLPDASQCVILLEYVLADLTTNNVHIDFMARFMYESPKDSQQQPLRGKAGSKTEPLADVDSDEVPEIVENFLKILAAVLTDGDSPSGERNARQTIDCIQTKVATLRSPSIGNPPDGRSRKALNVFMRFIQRRFPGFSWRNQLSVANFLPLMLRESIGGYSNVSPSLFIGSRRQLLRPIELLTVAEFDDILHRTLTDLHQLVVSNSTSGGYLTPAGQSKLRSPTGELILAIINNLLAEAKANPHVMARQLPLLSNCISSILQRPIRQLRDAPFIFRYLEFGLDVILCTVPEVFTDVQTMNFLLQSFLQFFENLNKPNRNWWEILEKIILILHIFADQRPTQASQLMRAHFLCVRQIAKRYTDKRPTEAGQLMDFLKNIENRFHRQ